MLPVQPLAIDAGGVCREFFSAFFEAAYDKYFDGCSLLTPVISPHSSKSELALIGLVISHVYISSGILPTRISVPCLSRILLPKPGDLPENIMAEVFMMLQLFAEEWNGPRKEFPTELQTAMISILSVYDCREILKHAKFLGLMVEIARHHFICKPAAIIMDMHAGSHLIIFHSGQKFQEECFMKYT